MLQSVPGVGDDKKDDDGMTREEQQEQERLRYRTGRSNRSRRDSGIQDREEQEQATGFTMPISVNFNYHAVALFR